LGTLGIKEAGVVEWTVGRSLTAAAAIIPRTRLEQAAKGAAPCPRTMPAADPPSLPLTLLQVGRQGLQQEPLGE